MRADELVMVVPQEALWSRTPAFEGFSAGNDRCLLAAMEEYLFMPRRRAEGDERYKQIIPYVVVRVAPSPDAALSYLMFQRVQGGDPRLGRFYSIGLGGHVNSADVLVPPVAWPGAGGGRRAARALPPSQATIPARSLGLPAGARGLVSSPAALISAATAHPAASPGGGQARPRPSRLIRRISLTPELRALVTPVMGVRAHDHPLFRGLRRELREEVVFPPGATISYLGAINDSTTPVGRVHLGLVFLLQVPARPSLTRARRRRSRRGPRVLAFRSQPRRSSGGVRLRREIGSVQIGALFRLDEVWSYRKAMESWSGLLLDSDALPSRAE